MIDIIIANFNKIAGTILGSAFVGYIGYRTYRKTRFNQAVTTFNSKILNELEGLYPIPSNWPTDKMMIDRVLRDKFTRLQFAVAEFRKFLPWYHCKDFDKAWFIYRMGEDGREIDIQDYWQYIPHSGASMVNDVLVHHNNTKTYQDNFKRNVDNLLKLAKLT